MIYELGKFAMKSASSLDNTGKQEAARCSKPLPYHMDSLFKEEAPVLTRRAITDRKSLFHLGRSVE
jgi:hypothetical protein